MGKSNKRFLTPFTRRNYRVRDVRNALAILYAKHLDELREIELALRAFRISDADVLSKGKNKSIFSKRLENVLVKRKKWHEKRFDISVITDGCSRSMPTHKIDCYKNKVALEIEWNNKDTFFDRDLNNFRILFDLGAIEVGVIITRATSLQRKFAHLVATQNLSKHKFVDTTTHYNKLSPRLDGGGAGGCPVVVFAITRRVWI